MPVTVGRWRLWNMLAMLANKCGQRRQMCCPWEFQSIDCLDDGKTPKSCLFGRLILEGQMKESLYTMRFSLLPYPLFANPFPNPLTYRFDIEFLAPLLSVAIMLLG